MNKEMKSYKSFTALVIVWTMLGAGHVSAQNDSIHVKAYAAMNDKGVQVPYEYNRRPVGDHDVLADILYCGICHSDVH